MEKIPVYMVYARLLLGALIPLFALMDGIRAIPFLVVLICVGFVADIFDGIVARWLNVSTVYLRLLDSIADRLFWIFVVLACALIYPEFMSQNAVVLIVVFAFDMLVYLISLLRFGKIPSPHNLLTKLWGILITISFVEIILTGSSNVFFAMMIVVGIISRCDSLLIYLVLPVWDHDIPSSLQAWKIRQGRSIKRHKLLNG